MSMDLVTWPPKETFWENEFNFSTFSVFFFFFVNDTSQTGQVLQKMTHPPAMSTHHWHVVEC